jgi:hypothetical protein
MHSIVAVGTGFVFGSLASSPRAGGPLSAVHSNGFNRACQPSMRQRVLIRVIRPATSLHVNSVQAFEPSLSIFAVQQRWPATLSLRGDRSFLTLSS